MINDAVVQAQIKPRREAIGLDPGQMAGVLNITISAYCDLETHPGEWRTVLPIFKLRFLVALLSLDLSGVVDPDGTSSRLLPFSETNVLIKSIREEKGLSKEAFADRTGFHAVFADIVEGHSSGLELYPLEVAETVANVLEIEATRFIGWLLAVKA